MGRFDEIPAESRLLDASLQEQVKGVLARLERKIIIKSVLSEEERCLEMAAFLKVFCALDDRLEVRFLEVGEDRETERELACENHFPATGIYEETGAFTGISFLGIPGGKELNSFVLALYNVAGKGQPLDEGVMIRIKKLKGPLFLRVYISLSCHHCAENVIACQRMAALNGAVTAQMVDARLYPDLIEKYGLERVPVTVVNGTEQIIGGKTLEEMTELLEQIK